MNDNNQADNSAMDGQVEGAISTATSEPTKSVDSDALIKNLKGEFNRKFSKINEKLEALLTQRTSTESVSLVDDTNVDTDVKQYVNTVLTTQQQKSAWQEALDIFPELNPESEEFDEKFYKAVDAEFSTNQRKDPRGPLKAAKLAAVELGKFEALTKTRVIKNDARRSRILSEGTSATREAKKEKDPAASFNVSALAKLGIKDPAKLAKRIKENKDRYE